MANGDDTDHNNVINTATVKLVKINNNINNNNNNNNNNNHKLHQQLYAGKKHNDKDNNIIPYLSDLRC